MLAASPEGETLRLGVRFRRRGIAERGRAAASPPCADRQQFFILLEEKALPSEQERNRD